MPQVVAAAIPSLATTTVFGTALSTVIGNFLVTAATGLALRALSPKPASVGGGYLVSARGSALDHAIVYGRTKTGGVVFYDEATGSGNRYLHRCIAIAGHEIDAIESYHIGDDTLTVDGSGEVTAPAKYAGSIRIKEHLGGPSQVADADLVAESNGLWTSSHIAKGIAYIYVRFTYSQDAFPNGVPELQAVVRGAKVYDPRSGLTAWSNNPALCVRDYLTQGYGLNAAASYIDDTLVTTAANICDESVTLASASTESRYTCNGSFTTNARPADALSGILTSMAGTLWFGQGNWKMRAGAYVAPSITLTEDDLRSGLSIPTRHSRRDNFNVVRGKFRSPESKWQVTDYPQVKGAAFVVEDGGEETATDLDLPYTTSSATAQRIAKIALYRQREQLTIKASFGLGAFGLQVGDTVSITNSRAGWVAKVFEVVEWTFRFTSELVVDLVLREISSDVFSWSAEETAFTSNNTMLPDAWATDTPGIAVSAELRVINQQATGFLLLDVTGNSGYTDAFEVEYRTTGATSWRHVGRGQSGRFEVPNIEDGSYDVRARAVNAFGVKGDWVEYLSQSVTPFGAAPQDVTNFNISIVGSAANLTWDAVTDADLSHYTIRFSPLTTGATYSNSVTLIPKIPRPATSVTAAAMTGTYFIRAVDKLGTQSENPASIVTTVASIEGLNSVSTTAEAPTFAGALTLFDDIPGLFDSQSGLFDDGGMGLKETTIDTSGTTGLVLTSYATAPATGTYDFDATVDLGAKYTSRVSIDVEVQRKDSTSGFFDSKSGLFDSQPGLFDGATDFSDVNVVIQVSTSDDLVAWSSYRDLTVGDFSARGFKFRAVLSTESDNVTPKVTTLTVNIDMPDRTIAEADVVSGAGAKAVTFSPAFKGLSGVGVSAQGMATGDFYEITSKSVSGFSIHFKNSAGTSVSRTFDYVAKGYGAVI